MNQAHVADLEVALKLLKRTFDEVRGERDVLRSERNEFIRTIEQQMIERKQLETLLTACQRALRDMQAQRDKAREGKR